MNTSFRSMILMAALPALAACGRGETGAAFVHFSFAGDGRIALHSRTAADALLAADGGLRIEGNPVALTAPQQALLRDYYASIETLQRDAAATGAAGARTGATAIGSVVSGLVSGNPDSIGPKIDAAAAKVEAAAAKICGDLAALHTQQDALTAQLPAFRPYASVSAAEVASCSGK